MVALYRAIKAMPGYDRQKQLVAELGRAFSTSQYLSRLKKYWNVEFATDPDKFIAQV